MNEYRPVINLKKPTPTPLRVSPPTPPRPSSVPTATLPRPLTEVRKSARVHFRKRLLAAGVVAVVVIGIYIFVRVHGRIAANGASQSASAILGATSVSNDGDIVARVGKLMLVPQDEVPTIAMVKDLAPLNGQDFFKNAKVGDVVLMYAKSRQAVLFDPVANKIIQVGPITN